MPVGNWWGCWTGLKLQPPAPRRKASGPSGCALTDTPVRRLANCSAPRLTMWPHGSPRPETTSVWWASPVCSFRIAKKVEQAGTGRGKMGNTDGGDGLWISRLRRFSGCRITLSPIWTRRSRWWPSPRCRSFPLGTPTGCLRNGWASRQRSISAGCGFPTPPCVWSRNSALSPTRPMTAAFKV